MSTVSLNTLCKSKDFLLKIMSMGELALISHMKGQFHQTNVKTVNLLQTLFFKLKTGADGNLTNGAMVTKSNEVDTIVLLSVGALHAEIVLLVVLVAFDT